MNYFSYSSLYYFLASIGTMALLVIFLVISIVVLLIVAEWKLFKKAGRHGWESLIPFYSSWVLIDIAGLKWWWILFLIIEFTFKFDFGGFFLSFNIAKIFGSFNCYYNIAKRFGKDNSTCIIAGIFPTIFACIFAFSKNEVYDASIPVSVNGIFGGDETFNDSEYKNTRNTNIEKNENLGYDESTDSVDGDNIGNDNNTSDDKNDDMKKKYSYCANCGLKLGNDIKYCPKCGKKKI